MMHWAAVYARLIKICQHIAYIIITSLHYIQTDMMSVSEALTCTLSCFIAFNTLSGLALRLDGRHSHIRKLLSLHV